MLGLPVARTFAELLQQKLQLFVSELSEAIREPGGEIILDDETIPVVGLCGHKVS